MESLIKGLADGLYGIPLNNVRNNFMFGNCESKRLIFWEEPVITNENIETVKTMFAGGPFSTDVKYKSQVIIDPTPVIVTANRSVTNGLVNDAAITLKNRVYQFYMKNALTDINDIFPITFDDWKEFYYWCFSNEQ
jgi:hypothetical protein